MVLQVNKLFAHGINDLCKLYMTRIMALDVGDARIGIALSDPLHLTAQPLETIVRSDKYIDKLLGIIVKYEVREILVGLPLNLDGTESVQSGKVRGFIKKLNAALERKLADLKVRVGVIDERFSTAQAERVVVGSGLKNKERSAAIDRISAAIILESHLFAMSKF